MSNLYYLFSVKDKCFTDLSFILKEQKQFERFYGLAYAKTPPLKNKIYSHISYISDILTQRGKVDHDFLYNIEKKYNVNISEMIHVDRHLLQYKKDQRFFIAEKLLKLFINEMSEFKISTVIASGIADFISFFALHFCKHHAITFLYPMYVGYEGGTYLSDNIEANPIHFTQHFSNTLSLIKQKKIDTTSLAGKLKEYIEMKKKPSYILVNSYQMFRWNDVMVFFRALFSYLYDRRGLHYDKFPLFIPFYRLLRIVRKNRYRGFLKKNAVDFATLTSNYFVYPLHFEPEASTLVQARWFNDQRKIIELISKNLPANTVLLVKEHKPSVGRRGLQYYKDIANNHNVFFIDDLTDNFSLLSRSQGVIVLTSTMGIEALMLEKPVMSFGDRSYNVSNNVYRVSSFKEIKSLISNMLEHQFDHENALAYFHTLLMTSRDMGSLSHEDYTKSDLEKFAAEVKNISDCKESSVLERA